MTARPVQPFAPSWLCNALIDTAALAAARRRQRPANPAALARRIIRGYRLTPTTALIGFAVAEAIRTPDARLIICAPPRESKSTTVAIAGMLWALSRDPDSKVILASYADQLATDHSHVARALVNEHADVLGFAVDQSKSAVDRWRVEGHAGAVLATGVMSGISGFGCDALILDDVVKNMQEADSPAHRRRVLHEFRSTLLSRVHPGGSVIICGTRWEPTDLIGTLLAEEGDRWECLNVPAISQSGIEDVLERPFGQPMTSAMGRTAAGFDDLRRALGSRSWFALYQGTPSSPEGGLVKREWLDQWRMPAAPSAPVLTVVGVDPADAGDRDAAGVIAASLTRDGVVAIIADLSAPMTSDAWARAAIELAIDVGASEIAIEAFAARATYVRVVREALSRYRIGRPIKVTGWPPLGSGRGGGDSMARAAGLLQGLETGTCRIVSYLPDLEAAAVGWQAGQHCPDALSACVVAHDVLVHSAGQGIVFGAGDMSSPANVLSMQAFLSQKLVLGGW